MRLVGCIGFDAWISLHLLWWSGGRRMWQTWVGPMGAVGCNLYRGRFVTGSIWTPGGHFTGWHHGGSLNQILGWSTASLHSKWEVSRVACGVFVPCEDSFSSKFNLTFFNHQKSLFTQLCTVCICQVMMPISCPGQYVRSTYEVGQGCQYHICVLMLSLFWQVGWFEWP